MRDCCLGQPVVYQTDGGFRPTDGRGEPTRHRGGLSPALLTIARAVGCLHLLILFTCVVWAVDLPLDAYAYKSIHNSFERRAEDDGDCSPEGHDCVPLNVQLDDYGVWMVELDIRMPDSSCGVCEGGVRDGLLCGGFVGCDDGACTSVGSSCSVIVRHDDGCNDTGSGLLRTYLDQLSRARSINYRLTFLGLDVKEAGACESGGTDWLRRLEGELTSSGVFESHEFYTRREFEDVDLGRWPSHQELFDRGRRFIVALMGEDEALVPDDGFFFAAVECLEATHDPCGGLFDWDCSTLFSNVGHAKFVNFKYCSSDSGDEAPNVCTLHEGSVPNEQGRGFLWRAWDIDDEGEFSFSISEHCGVNFPSHNALAWDWTFGRVDQRRFRSPLPLIIESGEGVSACDGVEQYGTWRFPFRCFREGIDRATPYGVVIVRPGDYTIADPPLRIDKPLRIEGDGGTARIGG